MRLSQDCCCCLLCADCCCLGIGRTELQLICLRTVPSLRRLDYETDVGRNSFNIYRCFVHLHGASLQALHAQRPGGLLCQPQKQADICASGTDSCRPLRTAVNSRTSQRVASAPELSRCSSRVDDGASGRCSAQGLSGARSSSRDSSLNERSATGSFWRSWSRRWPTCSRCGGSVPLLGGWLAWCFPLNGGGGRTLT